MKKVIPLISACILLTGCSSMSYTNTDTVEDMDFPKIGKQTTVFVGEPMLIQGKRVISKELKVNKTINGVCYDVSIGNYRIVGEDQYKYYFNFIGSPGGVKKGALCDPIAGLYVRKSDLKEVCVVTVYNGSACYTADDISINNIEIASPNYVQHSLLYSGREDDQLKFTYLQKPSGFTHNVTYNIKTSDVIGYRGAQLKVHNADNEKITYTLIRNFPGRPQGAIQ